MSKDKIDELRATLGTAAALCKDLISESRSNLFKSYLCDLMPSIIVCMLTLEGFQLEMKPKGGSDETSA